MKILGDKMYMEVQLVLAIGIVLLVAYFAIVLHENLLSAGKSLAEIIKSDKFKAVAVAVVFVITIGLAMKYAKIDDPISLLAIGLMSAAVMFIALFYDELTKDVGDINIDFSINENKVKQKLWQDYADPSKNEVYFPGNNNIKQYANAAHVNLATSWITQKDFIAVVYTDQIVRIQTHSDDPKEVWNMIYYNKLYPVEVYVNGQLYVVYCRCDIRDVDWHLNSTVCVPNGKCYDCNAEYRHMPKPDAEYILNHPPWP